VGGGAGFATDNADVHHNVITNAADNTGITDWWETGVGRGNETHDNCLWSGGSVKPRSAGVSYSSNVYRNPLYAGMNNGDYAVTDAKCKALLIAGK
jgi:hypothetical protein